MKAFLITANILYPLTSLAITQNEIKQNINNIIQQIQKSELETATAHLKTLITEMSPQEQRTTILIKRIQLAQQEVTHSANGTVSPFLSFIIPCYNRAHVIHDVVESIYNQKLTVPFEVIAVDDASADNSFAILKTYETKYPNFFAYRNSTNKKAPTTRNNAAAYARGKYICNADSDDIFEANSIEPMLQAMIQGGYDIAFFQDLKFFNDTNLAVVQIASSNPENNIVSVDTMLKKNYICPCAGNRIYTKDCWLKSGGYLENSGHDSWSFSFKVLANGFKAYVHPGSGYLHRLWSNKSNMWWSDHINKVNHVSPIQALTEHAEFFTKESFTTISNYKAANDDIFSFLQEQLNQKKLTFIPDSQLNSLLKAYRAEHENNFSLALESYITAISNGLSHIMVYLKAAHLATSLNRPDIAKQLLNIAKQL